jgi:hypothetical protein
MQESGYDFLNLMSVEHFFVKQTVMLNYPFYSGS